MRGEQIDFIIDPKDLSGGLRHYNLLNLRFAGCASGPQPLRWYVTNALFALFPAEIPICSRVPDLSLAGG
jgi:hypothetical protein